MKKSHLVLSILLVLASACSKKEEQEAEAADPVQVAAVTRETVHRVVDADAVLYPVDQANIMSKIGAPVKQFYVNRGDHVKKDQPVAALENRDLVAAAAAARAQTAQAEANLRSTTAVSVPEATVKATTDVESARQQVDAAAKLLESRRNLFQQGALARRLVDEAQVSYAQAKAQLETAQEHLRALSTAGSQEQVATARAQLEAAQAQYRSAEAQVAYSEVRSPIAGVVSDRPLYPGDMASTGSPLATVMDISRIVARANVPQTASYSVKIGDPAVIRVSEGGAEVPGKVTVVSPATDPASTTVQVWVQADNPGERLKPGTGVRVAITVARIENAAVVPAAAILPGEAGGSSVLTVTPDNVAHRKNVEIGVREGDKVQIVSGVTPGEQVVIVGGVGVEDKAKVRIVKPGEKEKEEGGTDKGDQDKDEEGKK